VLFAVAKYARTGQYASHAFRKSPNRPSEKSKVCKGRDCGRAPKQSVAARLLLARPKRANPLPIDSLLIGNDPAQAQILGVAAHETCFTTRSRHCINPLRQNSRQDLNVHFPSAAVVSRVVSVLYTIHGLRSEYLPISH
jgi:hypothetical protein